MTSHATSVLSPAERDGLGPLRIELSVEALARRLTEHTISEAARELVWILSEEARLAAENRLLPYADKLALVIESLPAGRRAELFEQLPPATAVAALLSGFRTVRVATRMRLLVDLSPAQRGLLLDAMACGYDAPREAAALLALVPPAVAAEGLAGATPATRARLVALLAQAPHEPAPGRRPVPSLGDLRRLAPREASVRLLALSLRRRIAAVTRMPTASAAAILAGMAVMSPAAAAETLLGLADFVLDEQGCRVLHGARVAAVLERLEPDDDATAALLGGVRPWALRTFLERCSPVVAARLARAAGVPPMGFHPVAYPRVTAAGSRRSFQLLGLAAVGGRHIRIEERRCTVDGRDRLRVDLLEFRADAVRLEARRALDADHLLPVAAAVALLDGSRHGSSPPGAALCDLGLVRLADAVTASGALGGLNGSFYVDYGHLLEALDLGVDLTAVPGLRFGDPIGWYVQDGVEVAAPAFGRAALVVTEDGATHVRRVRLVGCRLVDGRVLKWAATNVRRSGGTVLYTGLYGFSTTPDAAYVDLSIVGGRAHEIVPGAGAAIPLTGFVVSLPRHEADVALGGVQPGDPVCGLNDFPPELGRPRHAMACGPLLVRDGQIDVDLATEEFGEKDTATLPFSLTRSIDHFRAARTFVGLSAGRLVLGTVGGTKLGAGPPKLSAGATLGELAQLCTDLDLEHAMAMDGGGSSSVVARVIRDAASPEAVTLNVPTGGADVPEGAERFINTHWLVFPA